MFWKDLIETLETAKPGTVRAKAVLAWKAGHAMRRVAEKEWDRVDNLLGAVVLEGAESAELVQAIRYGLDDCHIRSDVAVFWAVLETYQEITADEDAYFELKYASSAYLFDRIVEQVLGVVVEADAATPWGRAVSAAQEGDVDALKRALDRAAAWEKAADRLIEAARRHQTSQC